MILKKYNYVILLIVLVFLFTIIGINQLSSKPNENYVEIEVEPGDTIWKYAKQYKGLHNMSINDFVAWVEKHNHISSRTIQIGTTLILPIDRMNEKDFFLAGD